MNFLMLLVVEYSIVVVVAVQMLDILVDGFSVYCTINQGMRAQLLSGKYKKKIKNIKYLFLHRVL